METNVDGNGVSAAALAENFFEAGLPVGVILARRVNGASDRGIPGKRT
ncbi:MAG: hypothetical protein LBO04_01780 [Spirochaetaceae bacterium]|nr:hypothetical protein [Spirochaetaceae bacterium]